MKRKWLAVILAVLMLAAVAGCASKENTADPIKEIGGTITAEESAGPEDPQEEAAAGEATFRITAYSANGMTYDDAATIESLGMAETWLTLRGDHTGVLALSGQSMDVVWTDEGEIKVAGTVLYTFVYADDDNITLNMYDSIYYTLTREGAEPAAPVEPVTEPEETEPVETEETETKEPEETEAPAPVASGNEPVPAGDGQADHDALCRMMKYWDYCAGAGIDLTYEDLVDIVGTEAEDGGNDGPNSMTDYGDRLAVWYPAENATLMVTFRRPDDEDVWYACQWSSGNFSRDEWENADISDLLPKAEDAEMVPGEFAITAFMTEIETTVSFKVPSELWCPARYSDTRVTLYNAADDSDTNAPAINIEVQSTEERINFYLDSFENLAEIESRTIGGIEMKGRTYKNIGFEWTEYYGELPNGVWVSVKAHDLDLSEGGIADAVINSLAFQ